MGCCSSGSQQVKVVTVTGAGGGGRPKCQRVGCNFQVHSQQKHGFCCYACLQNGSHGPACEKKPAANVPQPLVGIKGNWQPSLLFGSGAVGMKGAKDIPVTETMHIEVHQGKVFATFGSWMTPDFQKGNWGNMQNFVARKDSAKSDWVIDMQGQHNSKFAARFLCLKSITWTRDCSGKELNPPVNQLAMTYSLGKEGNFIMFREDGNSNAPGDQFRWSHAKYCNASYKGSGTARAVIVHRDSVTGVDRIFALEGPNGAVSGVYDPNSKNAGKVVWDGQPEKVELAKGGSLPFRCLSLVGANGKLYMSSGGFILQRFDGPKPVWKVVMDVEKVVTVGGKLMEEVGGIRGMTAIPDPSGNGSSIMLSWNPNSNSKSWLVRCDPDGDQLKGTNETNITGLAAQYHGHHDVSYTIAAYNDMLPVQVGGQPCHLIGFMLYVGAQGSGKIPLDPGQAKGNPRHGYWAGGGIAVRRGPKDYSVTEVGGQRKNASCADPPLVAVRCYANSPFPEEAGWFYCGGYDCNSNPSKSTAWVYKGTLS